MVMDVLWIKDGGVADKLFSQLSRQYAKEM